MPTFTARQYSTDCTPDFSIIDKAINAALHGWLPTDLATHRFTLSPAIVQQTAQRLYDVGHTHIAQLWESEIPSLMANQPAFDPREFPERWLILPGVHALQPHTEPILPDSLHCTVDDFEGLYALYGLLLGSRNVGPGPVVVERLRIPEFLAYPEDQWDAVAGEFAACFQVCLVNLPAPGIAALVGTSEDCLFTRMLLAAAGPVIADLTDYAQFVDHGEGEETAPPQPLDYARMFVALLAEGVLSLIETLPEIAEDIATRSQRAAHHAEEVFPTLQTS